MIAVLVLLLQVLACLGFGAMVLRLFAVSPRLRWSERLAWSFVLGMGLLGWLVFFVGIAGLLATIPMLALLCVGLCGVYFLGLPEDLERSTFSKVDIGLLALLATVLILDCFEGVAPPGDADSLAYHFNLPKEFLREQQIVFVPRAIDGAIPLLVQMTYIPVLGLGGEKALTLWTMFTSWGVTFMLFTLCRAHLDRTWSLALVLIWMTTPTVLYGGGSGQIEVRTAGFVILTIAALMKAKEAGLSRYVAIAGMAAGMFVGAKYTGLMFGASCGLFLFMIRHWPKQMVVFGIASIAIGFQWYYWNWAHTGDPVYPMLFKFVPLETYRFWDNAHQAALENQLFAAEVDLPNNPLWMMLYPFFATFSTTAKFDSERAGLGPFLILALPMVAYACWRLRNRILFSSWFGPTLVVAAFYMIWYLTGSSQRVRHLLPIYPILLVIAGVSLRRGLQNQKLIVPVMFAGLLTLGLQVAANGASSLNYLRYTLNGETRDAFLQRNISGYDAAIWINKNLDPSARVLIVNRQLLYLVNPRTYYGHLVLQNTVDLLPTQKDPALFYKQLKNVNITHILSFPDHPDNFDKRGDLGGFGLWRKLVVANCAKVVGRIPFNYVQSRSLSAPKASAHQHLVLELVSANCSFHS